MTTNLEQQEEGQQTQHQQQQQILSSRFAQPMYDSLLSLSSSVVEDKEVYVNTEPSETTIIFTKNDSTTIISNLESLSNNNVDQHDHNQNHDDEADDSNDNMNRENKNISVNSFESMKVPLSNVVDNNSIISTDNNLHNVHVYDGEEQKKKVDEEHWIPNQQQQQEEQKEEVRATTAKTKTRPSLQNAHNKHQIMKNVREASKHKMKKAKKHVSTWLMLTSDLWLPSPIEVIEIPTPRKDNLQSSSNMLSSSNSMTSSLSSQYMIVEHQRSIRQRIHLILTQPESSKISAIIFVIIVICVILMNTMMILQTMESFQYTPLSCTSCNNNNIYKDLNNIDLGELTNVWDDDTVIQPPPKGVECICPPIPFQWTNSIVDYMIYFFTWELSLRILTYEPPYYNIHHHYNLYYHWISYYISFLMSPSVIFDGLAVYPYYMPALVNSHGLLPLVLFRIFRVFYLVRLGKYNQTFLSFMNVLRKSYDYLRILIMILLFGALIFGSLLYYLEQGYWGYYEPLGTYTFLRNTTNNEPEPTPFISIPVSFWWFIVTATTVGYGDMVPTSTLGRFVASWAMIMGVLVIAFPVGVFTDLWSVELKRIGTIRDALTDDDKNHESNDDDDDVNVDVDGNIIQNKYSIHNSKQEYGGTTACMATIDPTIHCSDATNNDQLYKSVANADNVNVPPGKPIEDQNHEHRHKRLHLLTSMFTGHSSTASNWDLNHNIDHNDDHHHHHEETNRMIQEMVDENYVAIHKDHLLDMIYHLQLIHQSNVQIRQSNQHIRMILKKYKHQIHHNNHNGMP